jgi:hypothetical protein
MNVNSVYGKASEDITPKAIKTKQQSLININD